MDSDIWNSFIPSPVMAVVLLYQVYKDNDMLYNSAHVEPVDQKDAPFFLRQTIGNACGTISLLHALCNNTDDDCIVKDSFIDKYVTQFRNATPMERADYLYEDVIVESNHL